MFKAFRLTAAAAVTAAALISGCSLAPDYERPSMPEGAFWSGDTAAGIPDWQKQFSSAELSRLIDQALKTNRDLKLAILNVAAYEAKYPLQGLGLPVQHDQHLLDTVQCRAQCRVGA